MNIAAFAEKHAADIREIQSQLAMNFDVPAQRIINTGFVRMGVSRFDSTGNDRWEMITCHLNGWEYEKPSAELVNRWARY